MAEGAAIGEAIARQSRGVTIAALVVLAALAWGWLFAGAGMATGAGFDLSLFPHRLPETMAISMEMGWDGARVALALSMWWVMMVAMMLPAAAPAILLYARVARHGAAQHNPPTFVFLTGYLLIWLTFSLVAVALQAALEGAGLLSAMRMGSASRWLSGGLLIATGLYQFSPWKDACLSHCRSPAQFISRHYRPGRSGALRLGLLHGAYCVGCCALLMTLLFVGGVMNLAWIALLTLLVAAEKLLPGGQRIALVAGAGLIAWGAATLFV